jgi:hypothetical protein
MCSSPLRAVYSLRKGIDNSASSQLFTSYKHLKISVSIAFHHTIFSLRILPNLPLITLIRNPHLSPTFSVSTPPSLHSPSAVSDYASSRSPYVPGALVSWDQDAVVVQTGTSCNEGWCCITQASGRTIPGCHLWDCGTGAGYLM